MGVICNFELHLLKIIIPILGKILDKNFLLQSKSTTVTASKLTVAFKY